MGVRCDPLATRPSLLRASRRSRRSGRYAAARAAPDARHSRRAQRPRPARSRSPAGLGILASLRRQSSVEPSLRGPSGCGRGGRGTGCELRKPGLAHVSSCDMKRSAGSRDPTGVDLVGGPRMPISPGGPLDPAWRGLDVSESTHPLSAASLSVEPTRPDQRTDRESAATCPAV